MYARPLPIRATDPAAINSQQLCDALRGTNERILDLMNKRPIENLGVNTFLPNALWLMYNCSVPTNRVSEALTLNSSIAIPGLTELAS